MVLSGFSFEGETSSRETTRSESSSRGLLSMAMAGHRREIFRRDILVKRLVSWHYHNLQNRVCFLLTLNFTMGSFCRPQAFCVYVLPRRY